MNITSLIFCGFVIIVVALYYIIPRRAQNYLLLTASYVFFATWAWQFPLILFVLTLLNFKLAQWLRYRERPRPAILWSGIGVNILALAFFKYSNFFVPEMLGLLQGTGGQSFSLAVNILLPVGLSYRILENISYLADVYRGQIPAASNLTDFSLYSAYFPKLLSGPIERARSFMPQLTQQRIVDNDTITRSFTLIVIGLVRKIVIADTISGVIPRGVFVTPMNYSGLELSTWLVAETFVIYNDFAGYTDIVRGISGLFGIELSRNFSHPFFSRNFFEMWTRWHITLSFLLRDYIYLPLSRALLRRNLSSRNTLNLIIPPIVAMLVSGLWHGANIHMLMWGAVVGLYLVFGRILSLWRPVIQPDKQPMWRQIIKMLAVFLLINLSLIFFHMDLPTAIKFFRGLFIWKK
ncbi:MAG: hypothetical protein NT055_07655, partial [Nitrospirae bacterium]|nr:hypothetical protein [Nitrospirota bacterium]